DPSTHHQEPTRHQPASTGNENTANLAQVAAAPLFLSPETAGSHRGSSHRKLGASSRPQLVHLLLQPKGPKTTDSNLWASWSCPGSAVDGHARAWLSVMWVGRG